MATATRRVPEGPAKEATSKITISLKADTKYRLGALKYDSMRVLGGEASLESMVEEAIEDFVRKRNGQIAEAERKSRANAR